MTNDIRVLSRERFVRMKDATSLTPKTNRYERRTLNMEARRHAKLLEASRIKIVGHKSTVSTEDKKQMGGLREEIAKADAPAGFTKTAAGLLIPIAFAFALANAKCGSATTDDQDMDTTEDDAVTDVQPDETPDADVVEDTVPDEVEQTDESVGPDADADVEAEDEGSEVEAADADVEGDGGEEDVVDVPDETPVCDPIIHDETGTPEVSGTICGIGVEKTVTARITEYPEGCGILPATSLESVLFRVLGPLPADLTCARGAEIGGLNSGVFLIVGMTPAELQMGLKLASRLHVADMDPINGGTYQLRFAGVSGTLGADTWLLDAAGGVIEYGFFVPATGHVEIDPFNGAMSWDLDLPLPGHASLGIIRLPLEVATDGRGIFYNGIGDEGWFTAFFGIDGAGADDSWRFDRDHTK
ncbi:MAG: hypothetical protein WC350_00040 [Candidatus Micrarchaeia archaeon]|jgi:hypothetical protein